MSNNLRDEKLSHGNGRTGSGRPNRIQILTRSLDAVIPGDET